MSARHAKKPAPRRPALDAALAGARAAASKSRAAEAAKTAIDAQAARIADLEAEVDRLKIRTSEAEEQREDWRREAAKAADDAADLTNLNRALNREIAALRDELLHAVTTRHDAMLRYDGEIARLDEMVRQRDATIAGLAAEAGRLSRDLADRRAADAADSGRAMRRRAAPDPAEFAERRIRAARDAARSEDGPTAPAPTADPVGFGRQPCETGA